MKNRLGNIFRNKWDWIGIIFAILGIVLNAQKIIYCWPCYMASNVFMTMHFLPKKEYPFLLLLSVYFGLNIWAWYSWTIN